MPQGSNIIAFFMMAFGQTLGADQNFMDRLKNRIQLRQVYSEDESDVVIAFVTIGTRAGTDIGAALDKIPTNRPVILVVLHHTFDPHYVAPDSRQCVNRNNVLAVDCLFHEDHKRLMKCQRNDEVLKVVTDRLMNMSGSPQSSILQINKRTLIVIAIFIVIHIVIGIAFGIAFAIGFAIGIAVGFFFVAPLVFEMIKMCLEVCNDICDYFPQCL